MRHEEDEEAFDEESKLLRTVFVGNLPWPLAPSASPSSACSASSPTRSTRFLHRRWARKLGAGTSPPRRPRRGGADGIPTLALTPDLKPPCLTRYLVIIDDVWYCEEWKPINKCLPDNNLGSRIVTTCRFKSTITEVWRDDFDALVYDFNNDIYYNVNAMLGQGFDRQHHIMEMCRGMPLAMACMISALAKEREHQEEQGLCVPRTCDLQDRVEEQVMQNGIQNTLGFEPLVESLDLGYNDLPHHMLKTCLLYCSIYPEDHTFRRNDLIRRWIAEGFVCKEAAEDYFDELVTRGLMKDRDCSRGDYKVHPMMRNYLRGKLREGNFITCTSDGVPSSPVSRLCIHGWPSTTSDVVDHLSGIDWHHIRSLVVFEDAKGVPHEHLKHQRVLDVQCLKSHSQTRGPYSVELENQHLKSMCGTMLRLRHLLLAGGLPEWDFNGFADLPTDLGGLEWEGITEIPTEIASLQHLETLDVHGTAITRLPAEIAELKQLKTLRLNWNKLLAELPRGMENLQHLEIHGSYSYQRREQAWEEIMRTLKKLKTLDMVISHVLTRIPRDIGELQQLKNLIVSYNSSIIELPKEIGKLQHLETLDLQSTGITEVPREIGKLHRLKTLNLSFSRIKKLPSEIGNLQLLEALYLNNSDITNVPRNIGKLQHLETLNLVATNVRKLPREIGGLKKLKNLDTTFGTLPFEVAQLSKLERFPKCVRRAWKNIDVLSSLAGEILSFSETDESGGDGGLIVATKHVYILQWIKEHFNNIGFLDIKICKLEEQDLKILREMPYLSSLTLRFEAVPRKPIVITSGRFAMLDYLCIDSQVPRITFQEGAMPRLHYLSFNFQFYGGPPNTGFSLYVIKNNGLCPCATRKFVSASMS